MDESQQREFDAALAYLRSVRAVDSLYHLATMAFESALSELAARPELLPELCPESQDRRRFVAVVPGAQFRLID